MNTLHTLTYTIDKKTIIQLQCLFLLLLFLLLLLLLLILLFLLLRTIFLKMCSMVFLVLAFTEQPESRLEQPPVGPIVLLRVYVRLDHVELVEGPVSVIQDTAAVSLFEF